MLRLRCVACRRVTSQRWDHTVARNIYGHARAANALKLKGLCATTWNFFERGTDYMREIEILAAPVLAVNYAWNPDASAPDSSMPWDEKAGFRQNWSSTVEKW
ncbi:MAG: hypothetical protein ACR2IE_10425 [Candidatus Sumerlaeaceae bacterium]